MVKREPDFTEQELRCIHREIFQSPWCGETFYDERRSIIRKLHERFQDDEYHLTIQTR